MRNRQFIDKGENSLLWRASCHGWQRFWCFNDSILLPVFGFVIICCGLLPACWATLANSTIPRSILEHRNSAIVRSCYTGLYKEWNKPFNTLPRNSWPQHQLKTTCKSISETDASFLKHLLIWLLKWHSVTVLLSDTCPTISCTKGKAIKCKVRSCIH